MLKSPQSVFFLITFVLCILSFKKYCLATTCKILPGDIENLSPFGLNLAKTLSNLEFKHHLKIQVHT